MNTIVFGDMKESARTVSTGSKPTTQSAAPAGITGDIPASIITDACTDPPRCAMPCN
jgi:hypothetical protein